MSTTIISYHTIYDDQIRQLEQSIVQGKSVRLEIIKDHFLDRAKVFKKYCSCLVFDSMKSLIAVSIGARTTMQVNGLTFEAGIGFDVKVHPAYRNKGIGRSMAGYIYKNFFKPEGLKRNFITLKKSNVPVLRLVSKAIRKMWLYEFVYLTIPSNSRTVESIGVNSTKQEFKVSHFPDELLDASNYNNLSNGLGYFRTNKIYRLRIRSIHFILNLGLRIIQKVNPDKYRLLPKVDDIIGFATLYNHTSDNIKNINEILEQLEKEGIQYLMVCCRKNDPVYDYLKNISINRQGYYILSDFPLSRNDELTIDVRCL